MPAFRLTRDRRGAHSVGAGAAFETDLNAAHRPCIRGCSSARRLRPLNRSRRGPRSAAPATASMACRKTSRRRSSGASKPATSLSSCAISRGARKAEPMTAIAHSLSRHDALALAEYFAAKPVACPRRAAGFQGRRRHRRGGDQLGRLQRAAIAAQFQRRVHRSPPRRSAARLPSQDDDRTSAITPAPSARPCPT